MTRLFPKIGKYKDAICNFQRKPLDSKAYVAKFKLHGTNASIALGNEIGPLACSKNHILSHDNDNLDFYKWAEANVFDKLGNEFIGWTIYGEWCGPKILSGTAINKLKHKMFFPFIAWHQPTHTAHFDIDILKSLTENWPDTFVLPFADCDINIYEPEPINLFIEQMEKQCPFGKSLGLEGPGEGLVFYPLGHVECESLADFTKYMFKAKTKHMDVSKAPKPAYVPPSIEDIKLVEMHSTTNRYEQMVFENGFQRGISAQIGQFIKAVSQDIYEEHGEEFDNWKKASKLIAKLAREWFMA